MFVNMTTFIMLYVFDLLKKNEKAHKSHVLVNRSTLVMFVVD